MSTKTDNQGRPVYRSFIHTLQDTNGTRAAAEHLRAGGVSIWAALRILAYKNGRG